MFVEVKYRAETDKGTMLYLEPQQVPETRDLERIKRGEPFVFGAINEFREEKFKYMGRNRVVCTGLKHSSDGLLLYVSLYVQDIGNSK